MIDGPDVNPIADDSASHREEGFAVAHGAEPNRLLAALTLADYTKVLPRLLPVSLRFKQVLVEPDKPIGHVYFVRDGVASVIATQDGDNAVEVGIIGHEGFVGLPILYGAGSLPYRIIMQVEGDAWRVTADAFRVLARDHPALQSLCMQYAQYFTIQVSQSVACNRLHTLEERCARWLLMTVDRLQGTEFEITHEFLAVMLGVRRAGVTVAMGALQSAGIIRYGRGRLAILDRQGLEDVSCDCYRVTRRAWLELGIAPSGDGASGGVNRSTAI